MPAARSAQSRRLGWRVLRGEASRLDERRRRKPVAAVALAFLAVALAGAALTLLPGVD